MSNLLSLLEELGITPRRVSVDDGGEYSSLCPLCGDGGKGSKSDRFHIWPHQPNRGGLVAGRFWCRQCGAKGDTIDFLIRCHHMDFPAACAHLGIKLDGRQTSGHRLPKTPTPPAEETFTPREYPLPSQLWSSRAAAFLDDCHRRLLDRPDALAWLADRGIGLSAIETYRLGYNESSRGRDRYRPRDRWGLAEKMIDGRQKRLWLPRGWVIPAFTADGTIYQLRIRRRDEDIARFADDIKYLRIEGSSDATMILHPEAQAHVVVECGFDAIMLAALFDGRIGAVTTWNASARPDRRAHTILSGSGCILNVLDCDHAGEKEQGWWRQTYRHQRRWPVPKGKDPGDAFADGVDMRRWLMAGLPPVLAAMVGDKPETTTTVQTVVQAKSSESPLPGEGGKKIENTRQQRGRKQNCRGAEELERKIAALPSIMRAEVESFRELLEGNPLGAWLSGDGRSAGPVCRDADWKRLNWEIYGRFTKLFYGPAHGIICELWEPEFKRTGKALRKG